MIRIENEGVDNLSLHHYDSIKSRLKNANLKNRFDAQNERIKKVFGSEYNFKKIVLATPEVMEKLISLWDDKYIDEFQYYCSTLYKDFSHGKKLIYKNNKGEDSIYNALKLVDELGLRVCPYCNRNFIYNTDTKGRRTCDIDHFFPQGNFPFLAISFYNLIPSCKACNFVKLDSWNTNSSNFLINPYDKRFSFDANFQVTVLNSKFYYNTEALRVAFTASLKPRIQNHIKAFHLDSLYEKHDEYVLELVQKKHTYSASYIDSLFSQYEGTIFTSREDVIKLITSNYVEDEDLLKRPLSKLTKDIVQQLDL